MILVFGSSGQVASELKTLLPGVEFLSRQDVDLTQPETCAQLIASKSPSAVINAAAYTAVDNAEKEEDIAALVNGAAPTAMAQACAKADIALVHISTDYVFDGSGQAPLAPDHLTAPMGAYGRTKLAGEEGVRASGAIHAILRTSWVFSSHGNNFVKTMLRLSETHDTLNVVSDQIGGPTSARSIANACVLIAQQLISDPSKSGTYHFAGARDVSWADFAREIFAQAGRFVHVNDIPTAAYPTPTARPKNARMDCTKLESAFGLPRPDWKTDLSLVLKEMEIV